MKNSFRISGIAFLAVIYFLAIGAVAKSHGHSDFRNDPISSQASALPDYSAKLFCNTAQAESTVNSFSNLPVPNIKNLFSEPWAITKAIEQLFETGFTQYFRHSLNFLIHYRKADIIFPFHYFW